MATKTIVRDIGGVQDVRAGLDNSTLRRLMSIGSNWSNIRIGLRISMQDPGVDLTSTPIFAVGVCSGTANPFNNGSATTTHWVGARTNMPTWTRQTSPINWYAVGNNIVLPSKRVGTTFTDGTIVLGGWTFQIGTDKRHCVFLDITKGSPNFTINLFVKSDLTDFDVSKDLFLQQVALSSPTITGHGWGTARTLAVDEASDGYLDAVNVSWDRSSPKFELSDIAIVRFA
jgi:hypothetical protein